MARLIARFWDVTGGSISIGGKNIKELSIHQLSELVSFVTQDNFLFNCSLKENIRLGNPNATDEEVYAAAKAACCDDFIARLEKGYDTTCTPELFSQGQWQLLSIARAAAANPRMLLLDEITANLDAETEAAVLDALERVANHRTVISISHRTSARLGRVISVKGN